MFRRRRRNEDAAPVEDDAPDDVSSDDGAVEEEPAPVPAGPPQGPYDIDDAPPDPEGAQRLDLGGMQVPIVPGLEVRVDMDAAQKVVAATLVDGGSALQMNVFAAPRTEGIWDEVRAEILASIETSGGSGTEVEGSFGTEVQARVPAGQPAPGKAAPLVDARFVGIDGPRWFVRGLFSGPAATDATQAERLSDALRALVVVRGSDAMAPREPLPLVLPANVAEAAAQAQAQAQQSSGGADGPAAAPVAAPPAAPPGQAAGVPSRPQRSLQGHLAQAAQAARARAAAAEQAQASGQAPPVEPASPVPAEPATPPEESPRVELQPEPAEGSPGRTAGGGEDPDDAGLDVLEQGPDESR